MAKRILAFITTLAIWSVAMAQDGLKISPFFEETYGSSPKVSSVTVSGDKIRENGLSLYRSVTVTDAAEGEKIAASVRADGVKAILKEISYTYGKLYFGFLTLPPNGKLNLYILFLNTFLSGGDKALLIYMEGKASHEKINAMLAKFRQ